MAEKSRLASLLGSFDEEETKQNEEKTKEETALSGTFPQRSAFLYEKCLAAAKDDVDASYIREMYNPATTKLDANNLYLNLMLMSHMQQFSIMDFYYDTSQQKVSTEEYDLSRVWWNRILEQDMTDDEKYTLIVEKNVRLTLYTAMFNQMYQNAEKTNFNDYKRKQNNILAMLDEDETGTDLSSEKRHSVEDGMLEDIYRKTIDGSVIMVTPDLTKHFLLSDGSFRDEIPVEEDEEGVTVVTKYITPLGVWRNRQLFEIMPDKVRLLKGFTRGGFFINKGIKENNKFIINPDRPLVYYNVIDNPMLDKPLLKTFMNLDLVFFSTACSFWNVSDIID